MQVIPKLRTGGNPYLEDFPVYKALYLPYDNDTSESTSSKSSKSKSGEGDLTTADLAKLLNNIDGLPSDMSIINSDLGELMHFASLRGDDPNMIANAYRESLYKIRTAEFNRDQFNSAIALSRSNGSLEDVAITTEGGVVVMNNETHEMTVLSPEQYVKQRDKYAPITNSHLLWMRAENPNYAFNNQVFQIVENGISLDTIDKMIRDRITNLGKTDVSQDSYVSRDVLLGSQQLAEAIQSGPNGIYKLTQKMSEVQEELIMAALYYAYNTLPKNAKTRLQIETQNGTEGEVTSVIMNLITSQLDKTRNIGLDYDSLATKDAAAAAAGGIDIKTGAPFEWLQGRGEMSYFILNPGGKDGTRIYGTSTGLTGNTGNAIEMPATGHDISSSEWGSMLDTAHASIAGIEIQPGALDGILLKSNLVLSVDYPVVQDSMGNWVPALNKETIEAKKAADKEIKEKLGVDVYNQEEVRDHWQEVNEIYNAHGLGEPYDSNGNPTSQQWKRFAVFQVYGNTGQIGQDEFFKNPLVKYVENDAIKKNIIEELNASKRFDKGFLGTGWRLFGNADEIFESLMWIPVKDNAINALGGNLRDYKTSETSALNIQQQLRQMLNNAEQNVQNTPSSPLNIVKP